MRQKEFWLECNFRCHRTLCINTQRTSTWKCQSLLWEKVSMLQLLRIQLSFCMSLLDLSTARRCKCKKECSKLNQGAVASETKSIALYVIKNLKFPNRTYFCWFSPALGRQNGLTIKKCGWEAVLGAHLLKNLMTQVWLLIACVLAHILAFIFQLFYWVPLLLALISLNLSFHIRSANSQILQINENWFLFCIGLS